MKFAAARRFFIFALHLIKGGRQEERLSYVQDQPLFLSSTFLSLLIRFVKGKEMLLCFLSSLYHAHFDQDMAQ